MLILPVCAFLAFARTLWPGGVISTTDTLALEYPWRGVVKPPPKLESYAHSDVSWTWHPWKIFYARQFQLGHFPLWSPEVACGYPIFADSTFMGYSIPVFLLGFCTPNFAINAGFFIQTCIGMAGMYAMLRNWCLSRLASVLGGIAFALGYSVVEWQVAVSITGAVVMVPWLVLALSKFSRTKKVRYIAVASLICGFGILQGSLQSMLYLFMAALAVALADVHQSPSKISSLARWCPAFLLFTVMSLAIAAIPLIPALEFFLFHNVRARCQVDHWGYFLFLRPLMLAPLTLLGTLYPAFLGNPQSIDFRPIVTTIFGSLGCGGNWGSNQGSLYIGMAPLVLACAATGQFRSDSRVRSAIWLIALPVTLMLLTPLYLFTYMRGLGVASLGFAALAAIGFDSLPVFSRQQIWRITKILLFLCALVLLGMCFVSLAKQHLFNTARAALDRYLARGDQGVYIGADYAFQLSKIREFFDNCSLYSVAFWNFLLLGLGVIALLLILEKTLRVKHCAVFSRDADSCGFNASVLEYFAGCAGTFPLSTDACPCFFAAPTGLLSRGSPVRNLKQLIPTSFFLMDWSP